MNLTTEKIIELFLEPKDGGKLWPPLNNYSLFVFGSEYNAKKYFKDGIYSKDVDYKLLNISNGEQTVVYLPEEALKFYAEDTFARYLKDVKVLDKFESEFYAHFPAVDTMYETYSYQRISQLEESELRSVVTQSFDLIWSANAWSHFSLAFDKDTCIKCINDTKYPLSTSVLEDIWERATTSVSRSFDRDQECHILGLLSQGKLIKDIAESCQYFYSTYKDIQSVDEVHKRLKITFGKFEDMSSASERLNQIKIEETNKKEEYNKWMDTLSLDIKSIVYYIQSVMRVRDHRKNFFAKMFVVSWRIAERFFKEAEIDVRHIMNTLPTREIALGVNFLKSKRMEIEGRSNGYVAFIPFEGGVNMSYDCVELAKEAISNAYSSQNKLENLIEVKGQIGCKGKTTGIVKIILDLTEINILTPI